MTFLKKAYFLQKSNQNLLQFIHASDDLLLHVVPANQGIRKVQPFLICSKRGKEKRGIYYIMADGHLIQIGDNAIIAFDILLKLHYYFDIEFRFGKLLRLHNGLHNKTSKIKRMQHCTRN